MDKRLIIKIKMPPGGSGVHLECPICKRSFHSAKGLGGHMRVHRVTTSQPITNNGENTFGCPICEQSWPSMKSLYGHMSKHRDRPWRGMIAPTLDPPLAIENDDNQLALDVQTSEGAERKRQRRSHEKANVEMIPEETEKEISKPLKKRRLEVGSSSSSAFGNKIRPEKKFVCTICNKKFMTYQALGGHTSHHVLRRDMETKTTQVTLFSFDLNELPPPQERGDGSW